MAKLAARRCGGAPCAEERIPHTVPGPQSGTPKDFRELAEVKGNEPPLPMIPRLRGMCFKPVVFDLDLWHCEDGASVEVGITAADQAPVARNFVDRLAGQPVKAELLRRSGARHRRRALRFVEVGGPANAPS
jgi:hypothetical protein